MKKDQLFKKHPSIDLFNRILNCFGLTDINDIRSFSRNDLKILKTVENLKNILPCKARCYLTDLNEKNVVTILRQILRTRHYTISSREKYIKGEKFIIYSLIPIKSKEYNPILKNINKSFKKLKKPILLTFD